MSNTFTDVEGEVYAADEFSDIIRLSAVSKNGKVHEVWFLKADATKIIALIAEAAK